MIRASRSAAKALLFTTAALALPIAAHAADAAQPAAVAAAMAGGRVIGTDGAYLVAAEVSAPKLGLRTSTDREGRFSLALPAGPQTLVVRYPGLPDREIEATAGGAPITISYADAQEMEALVVTAGPILGSQAAAIAQQRAADNIMNVIAADAIGRFPDQSAASALSRIPGVAIERDQGQERYVQLRGAPERWTVVSVDGMNVLGAEERVFRFDSVPAVVIQSMEVNKTLTPDQPAEALAGRINIVTASPFDRRGFHVSGDVGYGEMALGDGPQRQGSIRGSWSNDRFGVVAALAHYRRNQTTDNREINWVRDGDLNTPDDFSFRSYRLERENNAAQLGLEYRPDGGGRIFFNSLYSEFIDREQRNQYDFQLSRARTQTPANRGADSGFVDGAAYTGSWQYGRYYSDTFANTLGGDHDWADTSIKWRLNYTHTDAGAYLPLIQQNFGRLSLVYSGATTGIPDLDLYTTSGSGTTYTRGSALANLPQTGSQADVLIPIVYTTDTDAWTGQVDVARDWTSLGAASTFKAGVKYDTRKATGNTFSGMPGSTPILQQLAGQTGGTWSVTPRITSAQWTSDFARGWGVNYVDNIGLRQDLDALLAKATTAGLYNAAGNVLPQDRFAVDENILSAYAQNKWRLGKWEVLAGLRVESVDLESRGVAVANGVQTPMTAKQSYTDLFPSLHVNYQVTEDVKARFALISGVARPSFGEVRTSVSVDDVAETVSGGNPDLKPERAFGFDTALEWYLPGAGLLSASAFYRRIDDVLFDSSQRVGDNRYGANRADYTYVTTLNGSDGKMAGLELAYMQQWRFLPGALSGFGFQGNVTFLDGEFTTPEGAKSAFPGLSDTIVNASIFYEKYGLSARLSYQWRNDWLDEPSADATDHTYWAATEQLDLSLRYQVRDGVTVYLDASNLTDETGMRYQGHANRPIEAEGVGRRFMGGVRFNF
ncbi:TonB-dependent receptor [Caulobacter endophyticus]|uniref:TonB-dependent receptor n=1 Tax=Caulobacter endophyticus TaxID=2172652 RepID=A0A2T9JXF4_9CAUL|nr:TonB-dependent receptor [Caulobacter endophyticus]PVM88231.1 TonB-dependent receptor [Caulobacter endophyticus]